MMTVPLLLVVLIGIVGQGSVYAEKLHHGENEAKYNIIYKYGPKEGDKTIPKKDGGCSPKLHLKMQLPIFDKSYNTLHVCNNGVISFNTKVPKFTPDAPQSTEGKIFFALFWSEINKSKGKDVYYKETQDPSVLQRITADMNKHLPNLHYKPIWVFIVTTVASHTSSGQMKETCQAVLSTDGNKSFLILNYEKSTGLNDGNPVQAGSNGDYHTHYFNTPGPITNKLLEITATSNVNFPGRMIIELGDFKVPGGCIFDAKFAKEGVPFWRDSSCSTECLCQNYKAYCMPEACSICSACEVLGSFFTCKVKKEPESEPEPGAGAGPGPEPGPGAEAGPEAEKNSG